MMMFGSDALACGALCDRKRRSRLSEVTATTVPAGHHKLYEADLAPLK